MSNRPITLERIDKSLALVAKGIKMHNDYGAMPIFERLERMRQECIERESKMATRDKKLQDAINRIRSSH